MSNDPEQPKQSRASQLEKSMSGQFALRKGPIVLRPIFAVAAIGSIFLILGFIVQMAATTMSQLEEQKVAHLTTHGECICLQCSLNQTNAHVQAIRYRGENGETELVYLPATNNPIFKKDDFCNGPTPVLVEGDIEMIDNRPVITPTAYRTFPKPTQ